MTKSRKILREEIKTEYLKKIAELFKDSDILTTASNEITMPVVDSEGNEDYVVITVKIPTGSRDGEAYDGYAIAEEYKMKQKEKLEKEAERKIAKEKKIARDKKEREEKARLKEERKKA